MQLIISLSVSNCVEWHHICVIMKETGLWSSGPYPKPDSALFSKNLTWLRILFIFWFFIQTPLKIQSNHFYSSWTILIKWNFLHLNFWDFSPKKFFSDFFSFLLWIERNKFFFRENFRRVFLWATQLRPKLDWDWGLRLFWTWGRGFNISAWNLFLFSNGMEFQQRED